MSQILATVFDRYADGTPDLIATILIPGIQYFAKKKNTGWVHLAWYLPKDRSPLADLTEDQAAVILDSLIPAEQIETHTDMLLTIVAERFPERVFNFFGERLTNAAAKTATGSYRAIPHRFYRLQNRFTNIVDYALEIVRKMFVSGDLMFEFTGARLIAASFPGCPDELQRKLSSCLRAGTREEAEFVLRILSAYRGEAIPYDLCKEVVRVLPSDDELLGLLSTLLLTTGVVSGEFGLVEAYKQKREALVPWLSDDNGKVKAFAVQDIKSLDLHIAAEQRRSEEDIEMRKRMYDEPTDSQNPRKLDVQHGQST